MDDRSFYDSSWNIIPPCEILAQGENAIVILRDGIVIKMPLRTNSEDDLLSQTAKGIQNEQNVYTRLSSVKGILPIIRMLPGEIHLPFMRNGSLELFLKSAHPLGHCQLLWFIDIAKALGHMHSKRILSRDLHTGNILLDDALKPVLCDFGWAKKLKITIRVQDMVDKNGYTVKEDISSLGQVYHEIVVGHLRHISHQSLQEFLDSDSCSERVKLHLLGDGCLTPLEIGLDSVIEKCRNKHYDLVDEIVDDLQKLL